MQRYKRLSGEAGVTAFSVGDDNIKVQFRDGSIYLYTYEITGKEKVEKMKELAVRGEGLTTFINKFVREDYATKLTD